MAHPANAPGGDRPGVVQKYGNAAGYDLYMGLWSKALAPLFLGFAALSQPASLLDVGCGTGNLLAAAAAFFPGARLVGVDPSAALLRQAHLRRDLAAASLLEGVVERLPFGNASFDGCLSLLVLQEFADRSGALREMRRVTRPGAIVAACQWDFARMPVIAALVDAIAVVDPVAGGRLATRSAALLNDEAELAGAWIAAGFHEVSAARIDVVRRYRDFQDLWTSLLGGSTPSTLVLTSLAATALQTVRQQMRARLRVGSPAGGLEITAEAIAVRGRA
jgi:SAM-dependent methyltransferase